MNAQIEDIDNEYYEVDIIEEDEDDEIVYDDFYKRIKAELSLSEFNRKSLIFNYNGEKMSGVPIHEINKNNIIFNINNKLKKIKLDLVDID